MTKHILVVLALMLSSFGTRNAQQSGNALSKKLDALGNSGGSIYRVDPDGTTEAERVGVEQAKSRGIAPPAGPESVCIKLSAHEREVCNNKRGKYLTECRFIPQNGRPTSCDEFEQSVCENACR